MEEVERKERKLFSHISRLLCLAPLKSEFQNMSIYKLKFSCSPRCSLLAVVLAIQRLFCSVSRSVLDLFSTFLQWPTCISLGTRLFMPSLPQLATWKRDRIRHAWSTLDCPTVNQFVYHGQSSTKLSRYMYHSYYNSLVNRNRPSFSAILDPHQMFRYVSTRCLTVHLAPFIRFSLVLLH